MAVRETFDDWAERGRDRGMEERHWHTAGPILARMPVEPGDVVLDLGCGSGYAARALVEAAGAGRAYGLDAAARMIQNARAYTDEPAVGFLRGDFAHLPFPTDAVDHAFSMEAFYYADEPAAVLEELHRVLRPGGTFYCAVNYYAENTHSADWPEKVGVAMTRWDRATYRAAFRDAGFHVAAQDQVPDRQTEIPPAEAFPTDGYETRAAMRERYRELGTLLTVGVVP